MKRKQGRERQRASSIVKSSDKKRPRCGSVQVADTASAADQKNPSQKWRTTDEDTSNDDNDEPPAKKPRTSNTNAVATAEYDESFVAKGDLSTYRQITKNYLLSKGALSPNNILTSYVEQSTKMERKIRSILQFLTSPSATTANPTEEKGTKQSKVTVLTCHHKSASKLVGIVEVVKSESAKQGLPCWQYNRIIPKTVELENRDPTTTDAGREGVLSNDRTRQTAGFVNPTSQDSRSLFQPQQQSPDPTENPGDDEAFEMMTAPNHAASQSAGSNAQGTNGKKPKIRVIPTLSVCLATVEIPALEKSGYR